MPTSPNSPWWTNWGLSYLPNVYGPIIGGHSVQEALYRTIEKWLPAYIREVNRKLGGDILSPPKNYRRKPDFRPLHKDIDVSILATVGGTQGQPQRRNDATRAAWEAEVAIFVFGTQDWQETQALTHAYTACVRAAVVQHPGLESDGLVSSVLWTGETYKEGEHTSLRQIGLGVVKFDIVTPNAISPWAGPPLEPYAPAGVTTEPSLNPPAPAAIVDTYNITVDNTEES